MEPIIAQRLLKAAKSLRASLLVVVTEVDELCELIERVPDVERERLVVAVDSAVGVLKVERRTYTVHWKAGCCTLGCTMAFRLMERLAQRPNQYLTTDDLLEALWQGSRSYSTIRSTVCRLRARLRRDGLADLASMIQGASPGHYGLMLGGL